MQILVVLAYSVATWILLDQACTAGILECQENGVSDSEMKTSTLRASGHSHSGKVRCAALLTWADCVGVTIGASLQLYCTYLHPYILPAYPFWPLLQTSLACAVGLVWVWGDLWIWTLFTAFKTSAL